MHSLNRSISLKLITLLGALITIFIRHSFVVKAQSIDLREFIAQPYFIPHTISSSNSSEFVYYTDEGGTGPGQPVRQYKNGLYEQFFIASDGIYRREDTSWAPGGQSEVYCDASGARAVYTLHPTCGQTYSEGQRVLGDGARWAPAEATVGQDWLQQAHQIVVIETPGEDNIRRHCSSSGGNPYAGGCNTPGLKLVNHYMPGEFTFCTGITNEEELIQISGSGGAGANDGFLYMKGWGLVGFEDENLKVGLMPLDQNDWDPSKSTCGGGYSNFEPAEPHQCKNNYCEGTPNNPCASTPDKDCSIPVDIEEILSTSVTDEVKTLATKYLQSHLPRTIPAIGLQFDFTGEIKGCDDGELKGFMIALCQEQAGEGAITFSNSEKKINSLTAPRNNKAWKLVNDHATGTLGNRICEGTEECGFLPRIAPTEIRIVNLSSVLALKEECWNMEEQPFPGLVDNKTFGMVRCMNYSRFNNSFADNASRLNERDLFFDVYSFKEEKAGLNDCRRPYYENFSDTSVKACLVALNKLSEISPNTYELVKSIPDFPIATFPVIGGIDEVPPVFDSQETTQGTLTGLKVFTSSFWSNEGTERMYNTQRTGTRNGLGELGTAYYIYPLVAGQDTMLTSQASTRALFSTSALADQESRFVTGSENFNLLELLLQIIANFVNLFQDYQSFANDTTPKPFWKLRIPEELRPNPEDDAPDNRFTMVQFALYRNLEDCLKPFEEKLIDASLNNQTVPVVGGEVGISLLISEAFADLISIKNKLVAVNESTDSFTAQKFVVCELVPRSLLVSDNYAELISRALTPVQLHDLGVNESAKRKITSNFDATGLFQTESFNHCTNKFVVGEQNLPPCGEAYCEECQGGVCVPTGVEYCPQEPSSEIRLEEGGVNYEGIAYPGAGSLLNLKNTAEQNFAPSQIAYKRIGEREYYCNRNGEDDTAQCPFIEEEDNLGPGDNSCMPVASSKFANLITQAAAKHNVPRELVRLMIQGENCRFTVGGRNVCNLDEDEYFDPGVEYPESPGCSIAGSGTDSYFGTAPTYKGMFHVWSFAHHANGWGKNRDEAYTNVCSINDMTYATAKLLGSYINKGSQNWTREEMEKAIVKWASGRDLNTGCATTVDDLPDDMSLDVKNVVVGGIGIFCGYLDQCN